MYWIIVSMISGFFIYTIAFMVYPINRYIAYGFTFGAGFLPLASLVPFITGNLGFMTPAPTFYLMAAFISLKIAHALSSQMEWTFRVFRLREDLESQ